MLEFMILVVELLCVACVQAILSYMFTAWKMRKFILVTNIACVIISYALLLRFVYNHFLEVFIAFVELTF